MTDARKVDGRRIFWIPDDPETQAGEWRCFVCVYGEWFVERYDCDTYFDESLKADAESHCVERFKYVFGHDYREPS